MERLNRLKKERRVTSALAVLSARQFGAVMRIDFDWLPMATPLDPAEEPPGSIDPLGTLAHAERLADALLPGFTARMWRGRLLTFATVAAAIADRTVALMDGREDLRLEARLAFERLFVSAVVRMADRDPATYANAPRRLPGRDLAKKALLQGEPLTRANFLKGQAVNGPFWCHRAFGAPDGADRRRRPHGSQGRRGADGLVGRRATPWCVVRGRRHRA